ncbi:MAG: prepilin-type N-terminal cleavage/methylation domain-containing protein [Phycisphaerales bacterium]|nr:prepilin-type N-terminal cleavage/methylation domain-containing protein [Phycisphaerales bacterium]
MQTRNTMKHARPGFSLIELTAVLVILGILMAGAAVAVPKQVKKARVKSTKTSMQVIKTQINTFMVENAGDAPTSLAQLIPDFMEPGSDEDSFERKYYYTATPGTGLAHPYELKSSGADKEFGTIDDIDVWTMKLKSNN